MSTESASPPQPKLHEPYDEHSYADLRHELTVRRIRVSRSGSKQSSNRAGFIKLLRDWDGGSKTKTTRRASPRRAPPAKKPTSQTETRMTSIRTIRARRGCRFRLINVLISADFRSRWDEMISRGGNIEVNKFWLDVHAAFMARNDALDTLHFQDALFVNVTPNVILAHSAARLLQMWNEIVAMYRNAVAQAKDAAAHNDNVHSFFDFCAGRLDLLYLHMAMLLEPKLYEFIVSDKLPAAEPFSKSKVKAATSDTDSKQAGENKPVSSTKAEGKAKANAALAVTESAVKPPATTVKLSGVILQNPEMKESMTSVDAKFTTTASPKTAAAKTNKSSTKVSQSSAKPSAQKPVAQKKPQKAAGKGKTTTTAVAPKELKLKTVTTTAAAKELKAKAASNSASAKESKSKAPSTGAVAPTKESKTKASPPKPKAAGNAAHKKSPAGNKPVQTTSHGKRRREEENTTAIVEVPSVSDIVPHPSKRVHTTTTISTALVPRPADVMLPPDEWDILESRLRKVNENIDRCHRGLSSVEGNVSDTYKQSLEADLRFYSAIKQRLQEQLLVVMQSGY